MARTLSRPSDRRSHLYNLLKDLFRLCFCFVYGLFIGITYVIYTLLPHTLLLPCTLIRLHYLCPYTPYTLYLPSWQQVIICLKKIIVEGASSVFKNVFQGVSCWDYSFPHSWHCMYKRTIKSTRRLLTFPQPTGLLIYQFMYYCYN